MGFTSLNVFVVRICSSLMYMLEGGNFCLWMIRQNECMNICVEFSPVLRFKACIRCTMNSPNYLQMFELHHQWNHELKPEFMNFPLVDLIADLMLILIDYSPNKVLCRLQLSFLWRCQVELLQLNVMKLWTNHILTRVGCV